MDKIEKSLTTFPFTLTVSQAGFGGVTGLTPTLAIRDTAVANKYLDFTGYTFKTSGWTTKFQTMTELGGGRYAFSVPIAGTAGITAGLILAAEFDAGAYGIDLQLYEISVDSANVVLLRKLATNRVEQTAGNPGELKAYDDDDAATLYTWDLTDENGNAVGAAIGVPGRRSKGTPG